MVVDASVLLSLLFNEPTAQWCADHLNKVSTALRLSTVTYTECLIRWADRGGKEEVFHDFLREHDFLLEPPTILHAQLAAHARLKFPLNLGDCFVYALAKAENDSVLTLDSDFKSTDLEILCF